MGILGVRHFGITVSDMAHSVRFYCEYLGLTVIGDYPARSGDYIETLVGVPDALIDIKTLAAPDGTSKVELLQYRSHPAGRGKPAQATETGRPHGAFTVDDLMALFEKRVEYGCSFKSAPLQSPDGVLVAYVHDPDGTILELVQLPSK
jgi:glyoxylase I family protein